MDTGVLHRTASDSSVITCGSTRTLVEAEKVEKNPGSVVLPNTPLGMEKRKINMDQITASVFRVKKFNLKVLNIK